MGGESTTCKYREHEIQFLKISVLTLVCLYLPWKERKSLLKIKKLYCWPRNQIFLTYSLCLFFTLSGCKFLLKNEHLDYIREFIISFYLNNPYNFYSILSFLKIEEITSISKPFKLPELLYDVVILLGVLLAHF